MADTKPKNSASEQDPSRDASVSNPQPVKAQEREEAKPQRVAAFGDTSPEPKYVTKQEDLPAQTAVTGGAPGARAGTVEPDHLEKYVPGSANTYDA